MKLHISKIDFDSAEVTLQVNTDAGNLRVGPVTVGFPMGSTLTEIRTVARRTARDLGVAERIRLTQAVADLTNIETDTLN